MSKGKQNKQNKTSQAIVVYAKPQPAKQKKKNKNKNNASRNGAMASSSAVSSYRAALLAPFSNAAIGARVPDMFSAPTVPKQHSLSLSITTNASGQADLIILPNMVMPWISPKNSTSGTGIAWTTMDGATTGVCGWNAGATGNLPTVLTNYRIVSYGVRVYATSSLTATAGRLLTATSPVSSWVNYKNAPIGGQASTSNNATATAGNTIAAYGFPANGTTVFAETLNKNIGCLECSLNAIATTPLVIVPKVTSPEAFDFRQAGDSSIGFDINNQTSATYVSSGDASYLRVGGLEAVAICIVGAPASTSVCQVELIYHLEGAPTQSYFSGIAPLNVSAPQQMVKIIAEAARSPSFKKGVEMAANVIHPGLGALARNLF